MDYITEPSDHFNHALLVPLGQLNFSLPEHHQKGWGKEIWLANEEYCLKFLHFKKGSACSMHFHKNKAESFYLLTGEIIVRTLDKNTGKSLQRVIVAGDPVIDIPRLCPHQVFATEDSVIIEVSTKHEDEDSYRVAPGDSQQESSLKNTVFTNGTTLHAGE
jgi:mannose-6-phosphate isomerase-like protein (cupin superfamily)